MINISSKIAYSLFIIRKSLLQLRLNNLLSIHVLLSLAFHGGRLLSIQVLLHLAFHGRSLRNKLLSIRQRFIPFVSTFLCSCMTVLHVVVDELGFDIWAIVCSLDVDWLISMLIDYFGLLVIDVDQV